MGFTAYLMRSSDVSVANDNVIGRQKNNRKMTFFALQQTTTALLGSELNKP